MSDEKTDKQTVEEEQAKTSPEEISEEEAEDVAGGMSWLDRAEVKYTGGGAGRSRYGR